MGELPSAGAQGQWAWMLHIAKPVHLGGGQHEPMGSLLVVCGGVGNRERKTGARKGRKRVRGAFA